MWMMRILSNITKENKTKKITLSKDEFQEGCLQEEKEKKMGKGG